MRPVNNNVWEHIKVNIFEYLVVVDLLKHIINPLLFLECVKTPPDKEHNHQTLSEANEKSLK